jgi:hypothetical protein
MWGQWVGKIEGDFNGFATLNIDKDSINCGRLLFASDDQNLSFNAKAEVSIIAECLIISIKNIETYIKQPNRNIVFNNFTLNGTFKDESKLEVKLVSEGNIIRTAVLKKLEEHENYIEADESIGWDVFKTKIFDLKRNNKEFIFRGQENNKFKLETTFHRQNRRDLIRFAQNEVLELRKHLTASLNRTFNLLNNDDYSDLIYIAQHHGFPTPLLDWTDSPFVASFFAFHKLPKESKSGYVRIFAFDKVSWIKDVGTTFNNIDEPSPCLSPMTITSMNNSRALPQQSLVTFSNISNIEAFIKHHEKRNGKKYLTVYDIPYKDRNNAMRDLEIMGITAASLFVGLDGICSALKEKLYK